MRQNKSFKKLNANWERKKKYSMNRKKFRKYIFSQVTQVTFKSK